MSHQRPTAQVLKSAFYFLSRQMSPLYLPLSLHSLLITAPVNTRHWVSYPENLFISFRGSVCTVGGVGNLFYCVLKWKAVVLYRANHVLTYSRNTSAGHLLTDFQNIQFYKPEMLSVSVTFRQIEN